MKKLTINELKGYLGTGLKCKNGNSILELCASYLLIDDSFKEEFISICEITNGGKYWIKPLLYPLSSLTEYREDLGFVPIEQLGELYFDGLRIFFHDKLNHLSIIIETNDYVEEIDLFYGYEIVNQLQEWHIDVHNLIDRNLAINIKTLENEK
jgi:hypothetical protein